MKTQNLNLRLPVELVRRIDRMAKAQAETRTAIIRRLLHAAMEAKP